MTSLGGRERRGPFPDWSERGTAGGLGRFWEAQHEVTLSV